LLSDSVWSHGLEVNRALIAANIALVLVTLAYAIPTWRMVNEMRRTRLLTILPRVALDVKHLGAGLGFITVSNIGKGPAIDVRATLCFEGLAESREIVFHTLSEGETHSFLTPRNANNELMRMDELTEQVERVGLAGTMHDALGNEHAIDESITIAEVWEITKLSHRRLEPDHLSEAVTEFKAMKDALKRIYGVAERAFNRVWPPTWDQEDQES
jgi:hypothetical protein